MTSEKPKPLSAELPDGYSEDLMLFNPGCNGGMSLVVDVTGSMESIMEALRAGLITHMQKVFEGSVERCSLVCLDDHYGRTVGGEGKGGNGYKQATLFEGTTSDWNQYRRWLANMPHGGGADAPEAWACNVQVARELDPEANIWLVSDAFPHGVNPENGTVAGYDKTRSAYHGDSYPNGCPCKVKLDLKGVNVLIIDGRAGRDSLDPISKACYTAGADYVRPISRTALIKVLTEGK